MSYTFNPFTGNFDQVGAGGSASPYWLDPVANEAALPSGDPDGAVRAVQSTDLVYVYDLGADKWTNTGLSVAAFSNSSSAGGLTVTTVTTGNIKAPQINLNAADASNPGGVSTGSQTFAGAKTFNGAITAAGWNWIKCI